jgi:hypothetical protein
MRQPPANFDLEPAGLGAGSGSAPSRLHLGVTPKGQGRARLDVVENGPGIPEVFLQFHQRHAFPEPGLAIEVKQPGGPGFG